MWCPAWEAEAGGAPRVQQVFEGLAPSARTPTANHSSKVCLGEPVSSPGLQNMPVWHKGTEGPKTIITLGNVDLQSR